MDLQIADIVRHISRSYGTEFFEQITLQLDKVIKSSYTFIAKIDNNIAKTAAVVAHGKLISNFDYALEDTPCKNVQKDATCIYSSNIRQLFPKDQLLIDLKIEGYLGMPLHDSSNNVMGIVVALYDQKIPDKNFTLALFQLFSGRIAAEFERFDKEEKLLAANQKLDDFSKQRTEELVQVVDDLRNAQNKLVEVEKMAALGDLVAGVAHEVNTPLGVAITAESFLSESFNSFKGQLSSGKLTKSDMDHFSSVLEQGIPMIKNNLLRAKKIIDNFKCMASDQISFSAESISLESYYQRVIFTLTPLLKRKKVDMFFDCCDDDLVTTFPGCHAQLLTNLVTNSIQHGFVESNITNSIHIDISKEDEDTFRVDYQDNGIGISAKIHDQILKPFFTTSRSKGNSGLGLPIAFNLVSNDLSGTFECLPSKCGAHFRYTFTSINTS